MRRGRLLAILLLTALPSSVVHTQETKERPVTDRDAMQGRALYVQECSACHGERGDGQGPAAKFLDPLPRDFTKAKFKLRTTPYGEPPATADVLGIIERGIPGTAMPSFRFLSEDDRRKLAAQVLAFSDLIDSPEPAPVPDPGEGLPATSASAARGKAVYDEMRCASCHGEKGKGDGPSAETLVDDEERPIKVRDFTSGVFRGGDTRKDLYYRFVTGMSGTPMPSFAESVKEEDRWALIDHVMSLRVPPEKKTRPADPIAAGREVIGKYGCQGCHVLEDGVGGNVGPEYKLVAAKLGTPWIRRFLASVRDFPKVYPWRPHRMPDLKLTPEEIDLMAKYFAAVGNRKDGPLVLPDASKFPAGKVEEGKNFYMVKCAQCHALGKVVETPAATQQGPDLVNVASRLDYEWTKAWILDPKKFDPQSKMTVPGLTPEEVDSVRMFIWKVSMEAEAKGGAR